MELKDRKTKISLSTYDVEFVDKIEVDREFIWGQCDTSNKIITIATRKQNGKRVTEDELKSTYYHELVHAILNEGQYCKLSFNEPLVEWIAICLLQLSKQKAL